jgi:hypothetical protein
MKRCENDGGAWRKLVAEEKSGGGVARVRLTQLKARRIRRRKEAEKRNNRQR